MGFETTSEIYIQEVHAIELNIDKNAYAILSDVPDTLHMIEGEFFYCDLLVDARLIVTEQQLDELLRAHPIPIHKIVGSTLYIHSFPEDNKKQFNNRDARALFVSTEEIDSDEEYEVFMLLKNKTK